jgi:nicotinic acid mononucleotide adenylyltransferase
MKLLPFIVFSRTATDKTEFETCVSRFSQMGMEIILKDDIIPDVSSTQVRANFKGLKELVPDSIYNFLTERGVYCG